MGMREQLQRAKVRGLFRGIGLAAILVVFNGVVAFNLIPSSYQQFSWEAYAGTMYTPNGGSCTMPNQCQSGFCVEGTCCNTICDQPNQTCAGGTCGLKAQAPAVSHQALLLIVVLLVAIGFFALTPSRFGKRR